MKIPRGVWIALGVTPLIGLFALLTWGILRPDSTPGSLAVFNNEGEVTSHIPTMPPFSLDLLSGNGGQFDSSSLQGKIVMVDFMASWCPPCQAEAPGVEQVWEQYKSDPNVVFVGVALWDQDTDVQNFIAQAGTSYPVGKDPKGQLAVQFGVTGVPEKYFIGPNGQVLRKFVGPMDQAKLKSVLDSIIASNGTPAPATAGSATGG